MSEQILVPLDGSSNAENAVPHAGKLARMFDLPLRFVHVADDDQAEGATGEGSEHFAEYAGELVEHFGFSDCHFTTLFLRGVPAHRILDEAEGASFLVLSSHGRGGFHATFIGSVADKVVRGATSPILVIPGVGRPAEPEFSPALVALDGSEEAERALTMARRLKQASAGHLILVRAFAMPPFARSAFYTYPTNLHAMLQREARDYLDRVSDEDDGTFIIESEAAHAILRAATQYDAKLVVMAASGKGLAGRVALGSTTDRVLHSLHRPLLIIPAGESK